MLIPGVHTSETILRRGEFNCPTCGPRGPFVLKRRKRFLTLFFVPLIPIGVDVIVECGRCKEEHAGEMLTQDPQDHDTHVESPYRRALRKAALTVLAADRRLDTDAAQGVLNKFGASAWYATPLREELRELRGHEGRSLRSLGPLTESLDDLRRENILRAACLVASSRGRVTDEGLGALRDVIKALGLPAGMQQAILADVEEG